MSKRLPLSGGALYLNGMRLLNPTAEERRLLHDWYDLHLTEVVEASDGFEEWARFRRTAADNSLAEGPEWLNMFELHGAETIADYHRRNALPEDQRPVYTPAPEAQRTKKEGVWKAFYTRILERGDSVLPPHTIQLIGMDPAADATPAELAEFDDFYNDVHLPEVLRSWGYQRATRWQLAEDHGSTPPMPRYLAVYEADEPTSARIEQLRADLSGSGGSLARTPGPRAWEQRRTAWRLTYRVIEQTDRG